MGSVISLEERRQQRELLRRRDFATLPWRMFTVCAVCGPPLKGERLPWCGGKCRERMRCEDCFVQNRRIGRGWYFAGHAGAA